jgi:hypothetical protein
MHQTEKLGLVVPQISLSPGSLLTDDKVSERLVRRSSPGAFTMASPDAPMHPIPPE